MAAPLAEPGQRLLARVVDTLIVGVPVVLAIRELASGRAVDVAAPVAVAGCMLVYEAVQLALWGRTLGKRFAGIEVVVAPPDEQPGGAVAEDAEPAAAGGTGALPASPPVPVSPVPVPGFVPAGVSGNADAGVAARPDVLRSVLRAAVYSLPIAARPIPVLGLLAGVFWVVNAGVLFEGTRRQAAHDRLAGTLVVKRARPDSSAL
ncbi:RDD family protein [Actinomadura formosensis]|uniref:RDD family protein n=1 Tax=Actinomadura formosensis TaxID=60706 RepID=UPI000830BFA1|nr:RDD family protein [Actinomadura formosensis]